MITLAPTAALLPAKSLPSHDLRKIAAAYILGGPMAVNPETLAMAQREVASQMAQATSRGLTEREVVAALLHPIFSGENHCGCATCRERCGVCRLRHLPTPSSP